LPSLALTNVNHTKKIVNIAVTTGRTSDARNTAEKLVERRDIKKN